jgi:hypothetical protein
LTENIKIRGYNPGDEEGIIKLLKIVFDGWPQYDTDYSAIDTWNWKFGREMSKLTMGLAEDGDQIVGTFLTWISKVKVGDSIYFASNGCDIAVDPNYRGFGIFNKTRDFVGNLRVKYDIKVHLGISGNPIVINSYDRNTEKNPETWIKFPFNVNRMIVVNDIDDYLKKNPTKNTFIKKIGYRTLKNAYKLENTLSKKHNVQKNIKLRQISLFDEHIDEFWDRIKNSYDYILERKKEYLNWRYFDPRAGIYRVTQAEKDDKVVGYSVIRINRIQPSNPKGYIVELLAEPGKLDTVDSLLMEAMQYFNKLGINAVYSSQFENHPYFKIYRKYGFVSYTNDNLFLWLTEDLGKDIIKLKKTSIERTHFSNGDEDEI